MSAASRTDAPAPTQQSPETPRQRELLDHIRSHGVQQVHDLARVFGVSASTVRRDLDELAQRGLIERHHGSAVSTDERVLTTWSSRQHTHPDRKRRIGEAAAALIAPHSTVLILGGTTTDALLAALPPRSEFTVITNSLGVAGRLAYYAGIEVVVLGGHMRRTELTLLGPLTTTALQEFSIDTVITGAYGVDAEHGVSRTNLVDVATERALLAGGSRLVVLADASKLGRHGAARLARIDSVHTLVTDAEADPGQLASIRAAGVEVLLA
ncbi:DeoR/GlpR family DNA-binding transcription regulator [Microbacteriaceae bacterium 4G12]